MPAAPAVVATTGRRWAMASSTLILVPDAVCKGAYRHVRAGVGLGHIGHPARHDHAPTGQLLDVGVGRADQFDRPKVVEQGQHLLDQPPGCVDVRCVPQVAQKEDPSAAGRRREGWPAAG